MCKCDDECVCCHAGLSLYETMIKDFMRVDKIQDKTKRASAIKRLRKKYGIDNDRGKSRGRKPGQRI